MFNSRRVRRPFTAFTQRNSTFATLSSWAALSRELPSSYKFFHYASEFSHPSYSSGTIVNRDERQQLGESRYVRPVDLLSSRIVAIEQEVLLAPVLSSFPKVRSCTTTSSCQPAPHSSQRSVTNNHQNTRKSGAISRSGGFECSAKSGWFAHRSVTSFIDAG